MAARILVMAVMLAVLGVAADAQELASDLSQVRGLVKPGDTLTITDTAGQRVQGTLAQLDATGIVLELPDKQRRLFDGAMLATVERPDSKKNGALIGFATGGVLGAVQGAVLVGAYGEPGSSYASAAALALVYGGIGAAIGPGIDAIVKGHTTIYAKSKITVSVAPVFNRQQKGVLLTLRR
jgi:hypothetical protein